MMSRLLSVAVLLCLALSATASVCRYRQGGIPCCQRVLDRTKINGRTAYRCRQCEDGYEPTGDKTQCTAVNSCAQGTGPPLKNVGNKNDCIACSDDNCLDCSDVYYWCNVCDDNYHAISGSCDQNLLY
jgi:hypothetical protein